MQLFHLLMLLLLFTTAFNINFQMTYFGNTSVRIGIFNSV